MKGKHAKTLEKENQELRGEIEVLKKEIVDLRTENERLKAELTPPLPTLPTEVLHLIFLQTVAPNTLLIPDCRNDSAWNLNLQMKLNLTSVSMNWYHAGISLLYDDIAIYRMGQFFALVATLRLNPQLAAKVRAIRLASYVLRGYGSHFDAALAELPKLCPNLVRVSFGAPYGRSVPPGEGSNALTLMSASTLTHLEIGEGIAFNDVVSSMHLFADHLVSLILHTYSVRVVPGDPDPQSIHFHQLQSLQFMLNAFEMNYVTRNWTLPALTSLACLNHPYILGTSAFPSASLEFIRKHGRQIDTLLLNFKDDFSEELPIQIQDALVALPHLHHLILPSHLILPWTTLDLSHNQVRWLDVLKTYPVSEQFGAPPFDQFGRFPNVVSYREVETTLLMLPAICTLLPPSPGAEGRHYRFLGVDILSEANALYGMIGSETEDGGLWNSDLYPQLFSGSESEYSPWESESSGSASSLDNRLATELVEGYVTEDSEMGEVDEETAMELWREAS